MLTFIQNQLNTILTNRVEIEVKAIRLSMTGNAAEESDKQTLSTLNRETQELVDIKPSENTPSRVLQNNSSPILAVYAPGDRVLQRNYDYFESINLPQEHHALSDNKLVVIPTGQTVAATPTPTPAPANAVQVQRLLHFPRNPGDKVIVVFQGQPAAGYREAKPANITLTLQPTAAAAPATTDQALTQALAILMATILKADVLPLQSAAASQLTQPELTFRLLHPRLRLDGFALTDENPPRSQAMLTLSGELDTRLYLPGEPEADATIETIVPTLTNIQPVQG